jgi:hypothetical protein
MACETCTELADAIFSNDLLLGHIAVGLRYIEILSLKRVRNEFSKTGSFGSWMKVQCNLDTLFCAAGAELQIPSDVIMNLFTPNGLRKSGAMLSGSFMLWVLEATLQRDHTWKFPDHWRPGDIDVFCWRESVKCYVKNPDDCNKCKIYCEEWYQPEKSGYHKHIYGQARKSSNFTPRTKLEISHARDTCYVCSFCGAHQRYGSDFETYMCGVLFKAQFNGDEGPARNCAEQMPFPHCNPSSPQVLKRFTEKFQDDWLGQGDDASHIAYREGVPEMVRTWNVQRENWKIPISVITLQRTPMVETMGQFLKTFGMRVLQNAYNGKKIMIFHPADILHRKFEVDIDWIVQSVFTRNGINQSSRDSPVSKGIETALKKRALDRMNIFAKRGYTVSLDIPYQLKQKPAKIAYARCDYDHSVPATPAKRILDVEPASPVKRAKLEGEGLFAAEED